MNMEVVYNYFMRSYLESWIIEDMSWAETLVLWESQICASVGAPVNGFMWGFVVNAAVERRDLEKIFFSVDRRKGDGGIKQEESKSLG